MHYKCHNLTSGVPQVSIRSSSVALISFHVEFVSMISTLGLLNKCLRCGCLNSPKFPKDHFIFGYNRNLGAFLNLRVPFHLNQSLILYHHHKVNLSVSSFWNYCVICGVLCEIENRDRLYI